MAIPPIAINSLLQDPVELIHMIIMPKPCLNPNYKQNLGELSIQFNSILFVFISHIIQKTISKHWFNSRSLSARGFLSSSESTCEILARYHAPGAGWYWNPHTAAINLPIYFLTYIFSHFFKKHIKIFFKNGGHQRDSSHRPIDHGSSRLTSTPARVLSQNIAFYPA